ncbi:hypothetical protein COCCADRAFT_9235 [Bipolaris zeicola 26-R-13]|uniref:Uncharacterized protein n=2 Tax=Bipolaris TaxID=33194 RepID=W6YB52_COCC2|nr:uncharacterized protein COCCADRAFT_9235 [Bipolaris zeicola 26-R-13]EUC28386.1 hypothetical protein COCCADRAFT_9235 [Bipolaris zeicola 26-R-13]
MSQGRGSGWAMDMGQYISQSGGDSSARSFVAVIVLAVLDLSSNSLKFRPATTMLCALHNYDLATLGWDRLLGHATVRAATSSQLDSRLAAMHGEPSAPWPITANGLHDPGALLPLVYWIHIECTDTIPPAAHEHRQRTLNTCPLARPLLATKTPQCHCPLASSSFTAISTVPLTAVTCQNSDAFHCGECGAERAVARRSHPASILQLDAAPSMSASSQGQRPVSEGVQYPASPPPTLRNGLQSKSTINSQPLLLYMYQYAPMHI